MTGIGTNWSPATGAAASYFVRVSATHGGLPFQFIAQIVSVQPGTITLNRPYPVDADSGTYSSYAIMPASRTVVLRYNDLYNTTTPPRPLK
jgi:pectin methylesterase-like acyl-CoA thioesterase